MNRRLSALVLLACASFSAQAAPPDTFDNLVDKQGHISLPNDFRTTWTHLGSYVVGNAGMTEAETPAVDLHQVYSQPDSVRYYREHGEFPDGAVLVKTVSATQAETMTTGQVHYDAAPKVTFVMVKDRHNRFPDNGAWGEGWGWALFNGDQPGPSQTTNWKGEGFNNCHGCHLPARDDDWVYTRGYRKVLSP